MNYVVTVFFKFKVSIMKIVKVTPISWRLFVILFESSQMKSCYCMGFTSFLR